MTTRLLPPEEWPRLAQTGCELATMKAAACDGRVIVVEQHGAIIGTCLVMTCTHVDGLWIDPAFRGRPSIGRRLLTAIARAVEATGAKGSIVSTVNPLVGEWVEGRLQGQEIAGRHFVMPLRGQHV